MDNELQDLVPSLLKAILALIWSEKMDWFFGVDMGIYSDPEQPAIVPDGFLALFPESLTPIYGYLMYCGQNKNCP